MGKRVVVALGGNALTPIKGKGTYEELTHNISIVSKNLVPLIKHHQIIVVSGSGPQIGHLLLQNELAKNRVPPLPLDVLDAELEGELGYLLEQSLHNVLMKHHIRKPVVSLLTQVVVDKNDPAFKKPSKPIGPFYSNKEARKLKKKFPMVYQVKRGWRRVVASPKPKKIDDVGVIKKLVKDTVVIAAGGGGIPVIKKKGKYLGVPAVIDKDYASARLALDVQADLLLILTGVKKVVLNYGKKNEKTLKKMTVKEAQQYLKEGQFPPGSMGPKIEASLEFLKKGGKKVIITCPSCVGRALEGKEGTVITKV
jgi:carbamate kinase